jgi:hypothetical protein
MLKIDSRLFSGFFETSPEKDNRAFPERRSCDMIAIIKHPQTNTIAALAAAILMALSAITRGAAVPAAGESFTGAAAELQQIAGFPIEIHATAVIANDPLLPLMCRAIVNGFRDAATDPVTHDWLRQVVHVVVIEGWTSGAAKSHVELKDKELTIRTMTGEAEIDKLRPLVAETLKKVARLKAAQPVAK